MAMKMRLKMKNRLQRYGINRPRPRLGDKCIKYEMCHSKMIIIFIKQLIEIPLKMMKNAFYFILKVLFVLRLYKFLSRLFGHVGKTA